MISKKNKALVAGILSAAMSATAVLPAMASAQTSPSGNSYASANDANDSYATMFSSLYDDVSQTVRQTDTSQRTTTVQALSVFLITQLKNSVLRLLTTVMRQLPRLCPTWYG